tara:strand:- start:1577 stop:2005 length:429 start_codon:yes stop_codon:yes gene_type:complete
MNIIIIAVLLFALAISLFLIEQIFSEHEEKTFIPKNKLDIPLQDGLIVILSRPGCIFCDKLKEYIGNNKEDIKYKLVIINYNSSGLNFNDEYSKLPEEEKVKINDIIEYNKKNPYFGFPTMYKKNIIQPGFDEQKADYFFKN